MSVWSLTAALLVGMPLLLAVAYRLLPWRAMPAQRPHLALFPKYRADIILPRPLLASRRPAEQLLALLAGHGFTPVGESDFPLGLQRGCAFGDGSVRLLPLRLYIDEPRSGSSRCRFRLAARWLVALDTGDLWATLDNIRQELQAPAAPCWRPGTVTADAAMIRIVDGEDGERWLARIARDDRRIQVQFNDALDGEAQGLLDETRRQLDYYFGELQDPDPWRYALHHCSTAANLYSPVRWVAVAGRGGRD